MDYLLFLILGICAGFTSGFFGIGGGSIIVPILMFFGFPFKEAVGISVVQMVFSSVFGTFINHKNGLLKLKDGAFLGFGGFFGAMSSGIILKVIPERVLIFIFALVLLFSIYRFFHAPIQTNEKEKGSVTIFFTLGVFVGAIAISLGIGGALFLIPILVGFLHIDMKKAVSMGLFFVVFSSISGFISLSLNGLINYQMGFLLGFSSLIGAYYGTKASIKINKQLQKKLLLILYVVLFFIVLVKSFES